MTQPLPTNMSLNNVICGIRNEKLPFFDKVDVGDFILVTTKRVGVKEGIYKVKCIGSNNSPWMFKWISDGLVPSRSHNSTYKEINKYIKSDNQ